MQNGGRKEASTLQRYQRKLARLKRRLHVLQLDLSKAGGEEEVVARIKEEQGKVKQAIKRTKRRIAAEIKAEKKRRDRAAKRGGSQTKSQSFLEFSEIVKGTPVRFCDRVGNPIAPHPAIRLRRLRTLLRALNDILSSTAMRYVV